MCVLLPSGETQNYINIRKERSRFWDRSQEMGFIREIDQAFSKSLMVEFLRLKAITGDDLSEILWTWQADMEATMDKLLRDLDAVTQTSTTLPSKNAAVGVALRQF